MSTFHVFVLNNKLAIDAVVVWGECPFNWKASQPGYCVFLNVFALHQLSILGRFAE